MSPSRPASTILLWAVLHIWLPGALLLAEGKSPPAPDPGARKSALKAGEIDLEKSRIYVHVGKKGFGHEHAVEGKIKSGSIDLNAEKDVGEIVFDMESFTADTDEARKYIELDGTTDKSTREKVTETMQGPQVLDVAEHPTAKFKIKSRTTRKTDGGTAYVFEGDFTLHGRTKPISVTTEPIEFKEQENRWHVVGEFTLLQSEYGIKPYKAALGAVGVADKLKIWGDFWISGHKPPGK